MPTIFDIYNFVLYITAFDSGEPFHVHVVSKQYLDSDRESHSAKIWLGEFGEAKIASNKGNINKTRLNKILKEIKTRKEIYDKYGKTVSAWSHLFGINPKDIDLYRNFDNEFSKNAGRGR